MLNEKFMVVFDFETNGLDIETLDPIEIACVVVDRRSMKIVDGSEFESLMCPEDVNSIDNTEQKRKALQINKIPVEEVKKAPKIDVVWKRFCAHVNKYNIKGGGPFGAPIPAGKNIRSFDMPIVERLCKKYNFVDKNGKQNIFSQRESVDLEDYLFNWFGRTNKIPNMKMDTIREYFGISSENSHRAIVDTRQTAELIIKFQKLYEVFIENIPLLRDGCEEWKKKNC